MYEKQLELVGLENAVDKSVFSLQTNGAILLQIPLIRGWAALKLHTFQLSNTSILINS